MARLDYFAPGVYVEEVDRGSRPIQGVVTAVAGFVGFTQDIRGGAEPFTPMLVTSWNQYLQYFARPNSDGFTDFDAYLPFAVYGWFLNGGGRCWVTSIGTHLPGDEQPNPAENPTSGTILNSRNNRPSLRFYVPTDSNALPSSGNSNSSNNALNGRRDRITVEIQDSDPKQSESSQGRTVLDTGEYFTVVVKQNGEEINRFEHLTMQREPDTAVADFVQTQLEASEYLRVEVMATSSTPLATRPVNGTYEVSQPLPVPSPDTFVRDLAGTQENRTGVRGIFEIDEVTIVACPDLMRVYETGLINIDQLHGLMDIMISLCEGAGSGSIPNTPNRMVIIDPPPYRPAPTADGSSGEQQSLMKPQYIADWLSNDFNRRSQFAALYYPWIQVANPRNGGRPINIPPSGHIAGVWARTDEMRGVYKAPANEVPRGAIGLAYDCNFREQELLNPIGINCIRPFPNRGIRVWGARTLVEPDNTEWRYINVRRLMSYIEKSIELGTQWVVFEPNDEDLWQRVKRTVSNFLTELWRTGALFGGTPDEAFYVKCDGELNTPDSIMLGRLYVEVGVAPVRPAEFVIFRFSQWTSEAQE
jgi:phage tail sheath protein FI